MTCAVLATLQRYNLDGSRCPLCRGPAWDTCKMLCERFSIVVPRQQFTVFHAPARWEFGPLCLANFAASGLSDMLDLIRRQPASLAEMTVVMLAGCVRGKYESTHKMRPTDAEDANLVVALETALDLSPCGKRGFLSSEACDTAVRCGSLSRVHAVIADREVDDAVMTRALGMLEYGTWHDDAVISIVAYVLKRHHDATNAFVGAWRGWREAPPSVWTIMKEEGANVNAWSWSCDIGSERTEPATILSQVAAAIALKWSDSQRPLLLRLLDAGANPLLSVNGENVLLATLRCATTQRYAELVSLVSDFVILPPFNAWWCWHATSPPPSLLTLTRRGYWAVVAEQARYAWWRRRQAVAFHQICAGMFERQGPVGRSW